MAKRKMHINSLRNLKSFKNMIKVDELREDTIQTLANLGGRIIKMAYASRGFTNRTGNLHDSYVSAVFKNGAYVKGTARYLDPTMSDGIAREYDSWASGDPEMRTGREEADNFIAKWGFSKGRSKGITLVVAASMFYSGIVESRGYSVISHITAEMNSLVSHGFNTAIYKAHIDPAYISAPSILREGGMGRMQIINM